MKKNASYFLNNMSLSFFPKNSNSLKDLAEEWRLLSSSEKQHWDEEARKEKTR